MKNARIILFLSVILLLANGCLLTKLLTVPMRGAGAAVSVIPIVGNTAHDVIDKSAETVDRIPF